MRFLRLNLLLYTLHELPRPDAIVEHSIMRTQLWPCVQSGMPIFDLVGYYPPVHLIRSVARCGALLCPNDAEACCVAAELELEELVGKIDEPILIVRRGGLTPGLGSGRIRRVDADASRPREGRPDGWLRWRHDFRVIYTWLRCIQ